MKTRLYSLRFVIASGLAIAAVAALSSALLFPQQVKGLGSTPVTVMNTPLPTSGYHFVGYSTNATHGGDLLLKMNSTCQSQFGSASRMCTSAEFLASPTATAPNIVYGAWVQPQLVAVYYDPAAAAPVYVDASGVTASSLAALNCGQWSNPFGGGGLSINADDQFKTISCGQSTLVTCCSP